MLKAVTRSAITLHDTIGFSADLPDAPDVHHIVNLIPSVGRGSHTKVGEHSPRIYPSHLLLPSALSFPSILATQCRMKRSALANRRIHELGVSADACGASFPHPSNFLGNDDYRRRAGECSLPTDTILPKQRLIPFFFPSFLICLRI